MKLLKKLYLLAVLCVLLISSCGEDNAGSTDEKKRVKALLMSGIWQLDQVTVDGLEIDIYSGLSLEFTPSEIEAVNGKLVWPSSETWTFIDDTAQSIQRGDGIIIEIVSIRNTELKLGLIWDETTLGNGKSMSLSGEHVFVFSQ